MSWAPQRMYAALLTRVDPPSALALCVAQVIDVLAAFTVPVSRTRYQPPPTSVAVIAFR
jgi:hypothetical protein